MRRMEDRIGDTTRVCDGTGRTGVIVGVWWRHIVCFFLLELPNGRVVEIQAMQCEVY